MVTRIGVLAAIALAWGCGGAFSLDAPGPRESPEAGLNEPNVPGLTVPGSGDSGSTQSSASSSSGDPTRGPADPPDAHSPDPSADPDAGSPTDTNDASTGIGDNDTGASAQDSGGEVDAQDAGPKTLSCTGFSPEACCVSGRFVLGSETPTATDPLGATITDLSTGLTWLRYATTGAPTTCESPWRMPSYAELSTLVVGAAHDIDGSIYSVCNPTVDQHAFPNFPSGVVVSSDTCLNFALGLASACTDVAGSECVQ